MRGRRRRACGEHTHRTSARPSAMVAARPRQMAQHCRECARRSALVTLGGCRRTLFQHAAVDSTPSARALRATLLQHAAVDSTLSARALRATLLQHAAVDSTLSARALRATLLQHPTGDSTLSARALRAA